MGGRWNIRSVMGLIFGRITVETPKYQVLRAASDYEIRSYFSSVVAEITYDPSQLGGRDAGFMILAKYIGAVGEPQNVRPEKIAMTAPEITRPAEPASEKIAMTAPVITRAAEQAPEKVAMTAPVVTKGGCEGAVTMQFVLPSKYGRAEEAPRPTDDRVRIKEEGERKYGVVRFSGVATDEVVADKVEKLRRSLERDGCKVIGEHVLARYNPPWTLPFLRTNEIMIPVE
ncbi:Heme-binding-like protein [Apostasia shenzhenica]|uniref:Heme-binding-like protein n=1 Tax=Apostasia shenzhenica TaxID=1088818 RepID=A0A2I0AAD6_9ASPA|nr:Heme-binding-like protein [Apostasia shenzhenica]